MRHECSSTSSEHGGILGNSRGAAVCSCALCALVYFARHPIMRFVAESWVVDEPATHADAIVVLGDDNFYADRATHAAELFRQGVAPDVVASGRRLRPNAGISELMEHDLIERGVPKDKIVPFAHDADSTNEEAKPVTKLAAATSMEKPGDGDFELSHAPRALHLQESFARGNDGECRECAGWGF